MLVLRILALCTLTIPVVGAENPTLKFTTHRIGTTRSEAVAVADFNHDGHLDIAAGPCLYLAPDWKPLKIRTLAGEVNEKGIGYFDDFANLPLDVNGDGLLDLVSCGWFNKSVSWFRQTESVGTEWPATIAHTGPNYESADLADIDGDGKLHEVLAHTQETVWFEPGTLPSGEPGLIRHVVSSKPMNFGGGVGDLNSDGRPDILRPDAWFEAPENPRTGTWKERPWTLGANDNQSDHTAQILVFDVNKDALPDVIASSAHKHGIFWYEQQSVEGSITWKQHVIDDTWSQAHSLALADINGDGTPDLVTGKRFMAHNGTDPDEFGKLGVYWYELKTGNSPTWTRHTISGEGIGSGMNIIALDLDKDTDIDVVVTGKWGGPVWFENKRL